MNIASSWIAVKTGFFQNLFRSQMGLSGMPCYIRRLEMNEWHGKRLIALMAALIGFHVPLCDAASVQVLAWHSQTNVLREMSRKA